MPAPAPQKNPSPSPTPQPYPSSKPPSPSPKLKPSSPSRKISSYSSQDKALLNGSLYAQPKNVPQHGNKKYNQLSKLSKKWSMGNLPPTLITSGTNNHNPKTVIIPSKEIYHQSTSLKTTTTLINQLALISQLSITLPLLKKNCTL
jgi:hypothetical protein